MRAYIPPRRFTGPAYTYDMAWACTYRQSIAAYEARRTLSDQEHAWLGQCRRKVREIEKRYDHIVFG